MCLLAIFKSPPLCKDTSMAHWVSGYSKDFPQIWCFQMPAVLGRKRIILSGSNIQRFSGSIGNGCKEDQSSSIVKT